MFRRKRNKDCKTRKTSSISVSDRQQLFIQTVNNKQGQKHRSLVTQLLAMTLKDDVETELLWQVAKGFDLPLVIGEQFICKIRKFQSASYHACLELSILY